VSGSTGHFGVRPERKEAGNVKQTGSETSWKIGELAKKTGLTVRMLHHYDRIGLLAPSRHTAAGHRLYTIEDLKKLQQIVSLKQLGFRLKEIKTMLDRPDYDPAEMLRLQLERLDGQIRALTGLRRQLLQLYDQYRNGNLGSAERFMAVMRMMGMANSPHFSGGQADQLKKRYFERGHRPDDEAAIRRMLEEFRTLRSSGKSPEDRDVLALARRWREKMDDLALSDPQVVQAAEQYYKEKPEDGLLHGMDRELYLFIKQALSRIKP
jgi:DNA-binding transcriptional MerR regulator